VVVKTIHEARKVARFKLRCLLGHPYEECDQRHSCDAIYAHLCAAMLLGEGAPLVVI